MAIALRVTGTWAEITTDNAAVTIPATPQAGDRMFLWVQWKDFAITLATPSNWTLDSDFSDGSVSTGNGAGSIHTAVFHRDWQSGDANPTLDFSTTTGLLAEAVITIFSKGASEVWKTPVAVTAAWPATSTTQTVSASSATLVPDNSVVIAGIGLRDDSATFTRGATTGIDVSSGITWSADYVESPATHYSTTTGNDHSGDLGHRMITTGGSGTSAVTLRVTATISATETGGVVWIIQGVDTPTTVTPSTLSLTISNFAPTVTATNNVRVTPTTLTLTTTQFPPVLGLKVIPPTGALTLSLFAPTVTAFSGTIATPTTKALTLTTFSPTVSTPRLVTPANVSVTLTALAPTVSAPRLVTPTTANLVAAGFAPTVLSPRTVTPGSMAFSLGNFAPSVLTPRVVIPPTRALATSPFAPTVTATSGSNQTVTPQSAGLSLTAFAPTALIPRVVIPGARSLSLSTFAPTIVRPILVAPPTIPFNTATFAPTISIGGSGGPVVVVPATLTLTLNRFAASVISFYTRTQINIAAESRTIVIQPEDGSALIPAEDRNA